MTAAAKTQALYKNPVAERKPRSDRLILSRLLEKEVRSNHLDREKIDAAHQIIIQWADLETSGALAEMNESQLQGQFISEVFYHALNYAPRSTHPEQWHIEEQFHLPGEAGGIPDAVIGNFKPGSEQKPRVVIELKGPKIHLDRDRSGGRTAVQQCWDYLGHLPDCQWGIVSNVVSFRLYERNHTPRRYEHFSLQALRDPKEFRRFYILFERGGLLTPVLKQAPRTVRLLEATDTRQREVGDDLYTLYKTNRLNLIRHLHLEKKYDLNAAIGMVQQLIDRIIFIAFCEDRELLPLNTLETAHRETPAFTKVTNPRWQNYKNLFRFIDQGDPSIRLEPGFNGGLFAESPADDLELDDPSINFFKTIGDFDFRDEVNLEVLGHLFEKSITELEKLREGDFFGGSPDQDHYARMPQAALRKRLGIYYTPPDFTSKIVDLTVGDLIKNRFAQAAVTHGTPPEDAARELYPDSLPFWRDALAILQNLTVCDPACGSGAFLFQAYETLESRYDEVISHLDKLGDPDAKALFEQIPDLILNQNLYGIDLSPEAVEITQLALWIRSARPNRTLSDLSRNIVHGNSLVRSDKNEQYGFLWHKQFPQVFVSSVTAAPSGTGVSPVRESGTAVSAVKDKNKQIPSPSNENGEGPGRRSALEERGSAGDNSGDGAQVPSPSGGGLGRGNSEESSGGGFDCVIGNPPWERLKLQEREFFSVSAPEIATATNAAKRRQLIAKLKKKNPELYARYLEAQKSAENILSYIRTSGGYPLCGKGDINTYAVFAELARTIVKPDGRVGLLVPSGIASDNTTKDFFAALTENKQLLRLYDFENKLGIFPDVHRSYKFCILSFGGTETQCDQTDFVFFAREMEELDDPKRHIILSTADIALMNPNTHTCPIFRTRRDADLTRQVYQRIPILIDKTRRAGGNPWGIKFMRMFDQTNDAELFNEADFFLRNKYKLESNRWTKGKKTYLPLYEAKMTQAYDHRAASVIVEKSNWFRQGQTESTTLVSHQNPEFVIQPRWWTEERNVSNALPDNQPPALMAFKNVTSPTNTRTMIASFIPTTGVINSAPLIIPDSKISPRRCACLLANLNCFALDYVARRKIGNVNLNFFLIEQFPMFSPDRYDDPCPWCPEETLESWISQRVLKLSCTAEDLLPLAEAANFTNGSLPAYDGKLNKWKPEERAQLKAELDAAFFLLYGLNPDDATYILSTFSHTTDPHPNLQSHPSLTDHIINLMKEYS